MKLQTRMFCWCSHLLSDGRQGHRSLPAIHLLLPMERSRLVSTGLGGATLISTGPSCVGPKGPTQVSETGILSDQGAYRNRGRSLYQMHGRHKMEHTKTLPIVSGLGLVAGFSPILCLCGFLPGSESDSPLLDGRGRTQDSGRFLLPLLSLGGVSFGRSRNSTDSTRTDRLLASWARMGRIAN
jgi:hypothetical protein